MWHFLGRYAKKVSFLLACFSLILLTPVRREKAGAGMMPMDHTCADVLSSLWSKNEEAGSGQCSSEDIIDGCGATKSSELSFSNGYTCS